MNKCARYDWCLGHSEDTIPEASDMHVGETIELSALSDEGSSVFTNVTLNARGSELSILLEVQAEELLIPLTEPARAGNIFRELADALDEMIYRTAWSHEVS